jgi:hypothetical protein
MKTRKVRKGDDDGGDGIVEFVCVAPLFCGGYVIS